MLENSRERDFSAPPERVWAIIEPVARLPEWFAGISLAELISGEGLGRRQRVGGQWGRRQFVIEQNVIAYEPSRLLAWQHDRELLDGRPAPKISARVEFRITLVPVNAGTRVTLTARHTPANFFAKIILHLVAKRRIAGLMEQSLERLAGLLEKSA